MNTIIPDPILLARQARIRVQRRRVLTVGKIAARHQDPGFRLTVKMITLTYAEDGQWNANHIKEFLRHIRRWYLRHTGRKLIYLWVQELFKSGRPHYHVMIWVREGIFLPFGDEGVYKPWWPHGFTNLKSKIRHGGAYLSKYLSKVAPGAHWFPHGARIFGAGGDYRLGWGSRWAHAPAFVRLCVPPGEQLRHLPRQYLPAGYRLLAIPENAGTSHEPPTPIAGTLWDWRIPMIDNRGLLQSYGDRLISFSCWITAEYPLTLDHKWRFYKYRDLCFYSLFRLLGCDNRPNPLSERSKEAFRQNA